MILSPLGIETMEFCFGLSLGKLFSSLLNTRLSNYFHENILLHHSQIGFLKGYRRTLIDKYVINENEGKLFCCFVDFQKASDSVWREGLLLKLIHNKIGGLFYHLISDMYLKSQCAIKYGNQRSRI